MKGNDKSKDTRLLKAYLKEKKQDEDFKLFDPNWLNGILTLNFISVLTSKIENVIKQCRTKTLGMI